MNVTSGKAALAAGVICAGACVASLGLGGVFVGITAGGVAALLTGEVLAVALVAVALTGGWYLFRRQRESKAQSCECSPDAGCHTGDACDVPPSRLTLP